MLQHVDCHRATTKSSAKVGSVSCDDNLTEEEVNCIQWLPDGKAFLIKNKDVLVKKLLPRFLGSPMSFWSFRRRLLTWGFRPLDASIVHTAKKKDKMVQSPQNQGNSCQNAPATASASSAESASESNQGYSMSQEGIFDPGSTPHLKVLQKNGQTAVLRRPPSFSSWSTVFRHPNFQRDNVHLLAKISKKNVFCNSQKARRTRTTLKTAALDQQAALPWILPMDLRAKRSRPKEERKNCVSAIATPNAVARAIV